MMQPLHDHDHPEHGHAQPGGDVAPRLRAVAMVPTLSLLRWSVGQRLMGACGILSVLWALVFWAML